jgi:hypothetical protein
MKLREKDKNVVPEQSSALNRQMHERSVLRRIGSLFCRYLAQRRSALLICTIVPLIGCAEKIDHDPAAAAAKAEEFVRVAFIEHDVTRSYELLAVGTRRYVSLEKYQEVIGRLHPKGYPSAVKAGDFEPMPGENAIYIFLAGENAGESFYYRLTMEGSAATGYRVLQFDRSNRPRR